LYNYRDQLRWIGQGFFAPLLDFDRVPLADPSNVAILNRYGRIRGFEWLCHLESCVGGRCTLNKRRGCRGELEQTMAHKSFELTFGVKFQ
jgi:hypothetical protein